MSTSSRGMTVALAALAAVGLLPGGAAAGKGEPSGQKEKAAPGAATVKRLQKHARKRWTCHQSMSIRLDRRRCTLTFDHGDFFDTRVVVPLRSVRLRVEKMKKRRLPGKETVVTARCRKKHNACIVRLSQGHDTGIPHHTFPMRDASEKYAFVLAVAGIAEARGLVQEVAGLTKHCAK